MGSDDCGTSGYSMDEFFVSFFPNDFWMVTIGTIMIPHLGGYSMRSFCLLVVILLGCQGKNDSQKAATPTKKATPVQKKKPGIVDTLSIPSLPEWTDRYAAGKKGDVRFFNLTNMMAKFGISRLQAVELQNHYRDLTRADLTLAGADGLQQALDRVRKGDLESKLKN